MKIQIDTDNKVIRIESNVNLKEFFDKIKLLFPNGEWKEYSLECSTIINWNNPIIIEKYPIYPTYPWYTVNGSTEIIPYSGTTTFNVEI